MVDYHSISIALRLLSPEYRLFEILSSRFPFETAIGINGRVWVSAKEPKHVIALARCIEAADEQNPTDSQLKSFIATLEI
jgi:exosome complex component RRP40